MFSATKRVRGFFVLTAVVGTMLLAATPVAASPLKFGAAFGSGGFDPDNGHQTCDHELNGGSGTYACTWIIRQALNGGAATAPADGKIGKIKLVSAWNGSLKVVLARKNASNQFKVVARSASISYHDSCPTSCSVQTYTLSSPLTVHKGDYLGAQGSGAMGPLRCYNGSPNTSLFKPTLPVGGSFTSETDHSGCYLEIQAVYTS